MAENNVMIATRDSYGKSLVELAKDNKNIVVLDADLAAATKTELFKKAYPDRFIDCGIAECNMLGVAAGLATTGKVVFASTFAMFAAGRAFEIIRNSIGYPHLKVNICATHAGISVGEDGATHQCCEDIALMRTIPGMTVLCPSDDIETRACIKALVEFDGPAYVRLGRLPIPIINGNSDYKFVIGRGIELCAGSDVTIVATGLMVSESLKAVEVLKAAGVSVRLINIHTIKPLDKEIIIKAAMETKAIVTVEEHSVIGGLGSAVSEVLSEIYPTIVKKVGVNDVFGVSGPAWDLLKLYGLTSESIVEAVKSVL